MDQKKIVCLGDSLTEGYPFFGEKSWVSILNSTTTEHFINKGICGQISLQIARRFPQDVLELYPDFVFLLFGSNDFLFTSASAEDVLEQYSNLSLTAVENKISPVLLIPPLTVPEMASRAWDSEISYTEVNRKLLQLRELLLSFSGAARIPCIDLQAAFEQLSVGGAETDYYSDGLHPTELGYRSIAEMIEKYLETLFSN